MRDQIRNLVSANRLKEAAELIDGNDGALLLSRISNANRQVTLGLVSNSESTVIFNQIRAAILSHCESAERYSPQKSHTHIMSTLQQIISDNRRRRPEIADEAQSILNDYRAYSDAKAANSSHDPAGRRYKAIQEAEAQLIKRIEDEKDNSLEQTIDRINAYLTEAVPGYENLKEAYKLASGRGMKNQWIEDQLREQPDDKETKIDIAEKIEMFISKIQVK